MVLTQCFKFVILMLNMYAEIGLKIRPGIAFRVDGLKITSVYLYMYSECYSNKTLLV